MDLDFQHPTDIYALAPCRNADAQDLVAIGGEHSVEVVQVVREALRLARSITYQLTGIAFQTHSSCTRLASFHIGSRITALAWSSRSISTSTSERWYLEYVHYSIQMISNLKQCIADSQLLAQISGCIFLLNPSPHPKPYFPSEEVLAAIMAALTTWFSVAVGTRTPRATSQQFLVPTFIFSFTSSNKRFRRR